MCNAMVMPETFEEFIDEYKFRDEKEHSAASVTIPVILNAPLCGAKAEATISRTGNVKIALIKG